jgi:phospholipase C
MGYHTSAHVPVYNALAGEFLVCERWFAAHPGPTFCNRFYTLTGRLNRNSQGDWQFDNPTSAEMAPVATRTLFDHLTEHGVAWRYYERGYCFLRMFAGYTTDTTNIVDAGADSANFVASAKAGDLPSVTFIDPDFIDFPPGFDDGAPADIARGQHFIGTILNAVIQGPLWGKTLFVITYDEHGGFYDHVRRRRRLRSRRLIVTACAWRPSITMACACRPSSCPLGSIGARSATSFSTTPQLRKPSRGVS